MIAKRLISSPTTSDYICLFLLLIFIKPVQPRQLWVQPIEWLILNFGYLAVSEDKQSNIIKKIHSQQHTHCSWAVFSHTRSVSIRNFVFSVVVSIRVVQAFVHTPRVFACTGSWFFPGVFLRKKIVSGKCVIRTASRINMYRVITLFIVSVTPKGAYTVLNAIYIDTHRSSIIPASKHAI